MVVVDRKIHRELAGLGSHTEAAARQSHMVVVEKGRRMLADRKRAAGIVAGVVTRTQAAVLAVAENCNPMDCYGCIEKVVGTVGGW